MPITKINTGILIPGLIPISRNLLDDCHRVIAQLVFADLGRGAGTLHQMPNVRLDLQGRTATGDVNLQVQIGNNSVAAAIIQNTLLPTVDPANQQGVANNAISVLNQSLDSGTIWHLNGTLP